MMGSEYQEGGSKFSPTSRSPSDSSNEESSSMSNNCSRANLEQLVNHFSLIGLNNNNTTASGLFFDQNGQHHHQQQQQQQSNLFASIDQLGDLISVGGLGGSSSSSSNTQRTGFGGVGGVGGGMPNSCSQIFYTAAKMNVNDEDTTFFTRECMHLLAKYLAEHSECSLFKSLYVYAPDNLGWLWSLIDWETQVEFDMEVPAQDKYAPFEWMSGPSGGGTCSPTGGPIPVQLSKSNRDLVDCINDVLAQAPMIKFEYRKQLMIGDMYQFLSTVNEMERNTNSNVSKSLFLLYFPRFAKYIDNPLRNNMQVKLLAANLRLVKQLDEMICNLIRTRYIDLSEYKQKILTRYQLPTQVEKLVYERELQQSSVYRNIMLTLISDSKFQQRLRELNSVGSGGGGLTSNNNMNNNNNSNMYNKLATSTPAINNNTLLNSFWLSQQQQTNNRAAVAALNMFTSSYMKDLEKVRMNEELDHNNDELDMIMSARMTSDENNNINNTTSSIINNSSTATASDSYLAESSQFLIEPNQVRSSMGRMNAALDHTSNSTAAFNYDDSTASNADFLYLNSSNASLGALMSPFANAAASINNQFQSQFSSGGQQSTPQHQQRSAVGHRSSNTSGQLMSPVGASFNSKIYATPNAVPTGVSSALKSNLITPPPSASVSRTNITGYRNNNNDRLNENSSSSFFDYLGTNPISPVTTSYRAFSGKSFQDIHEFVPRNFQNTTTNNTSSGSNSHNKSATASYGNLSVKLNNLSQYSSGAGLKSPNGNRSGGYFSPGSSSSTSNTSSPSQSQITMSSNNSSLIWLGRLPPKVYSTESAYSRKVFLGGLPWDADQFSLLAMLQQFGQVKLEVPGKDAKHPRMPNKIQERNTPGYLYIIFDQEASVRGLLDSCHKLSKNGGEHFYTNVIIASNSNNNNNNGYRNNHNHHGSRHDMPAGMVRTKEVEVIPWNQDDTSYVPRGDLANLPSKIDSKCTIFVGGLHGMLTARGLAQVMTETFGEVIHAGLDTDKYKYPIGSGRVTFRRREDYVKAIKARFVNIKANTSVNDPSPKFEKTIQIDPYLEDAKCCKCPVKSQKFCRNEYCLDYYCDSCWLCNHDTFRGGEHHGLSRQNKTTNHI